MTPQDQAQIWRNAAAGYRKDGALRRNLPYRAAYELSAAHCEQLADGLERGTISLASSLDRGEPRL